MEDINQLNQSIIRDYNMNCFSFKVSNFIYYIKALQASRQFILNTISFHIPFSISEGFFFSNYIDTVFVSLSLNAWHCYRHHSLAGSWMHSVWILSCLF